jgi:VWFA-related protein
VTISRVLNACLWVTASLAVAQPQPAHEQIEVSVVNVDVAVFGKDGRAVAGLTRDQFEVLEDGQLQVLTNFYEARGDPPANSTSTVDEHDRRKFLVLVDLLHTSKQRRDLALANLETVINTTLRTGNYEWSVAAMRTGIVLLAPFTTDASATHRAFEQLRGMAGLRDLQIQGVARNPSESEIKARFTTDALVGAIRGFDGSIGKNNILLLTGDLQLNSLEMAGFSPENTGGKLADSDFADKDRRLSEFREAIIEEANRSGVALFIVNIEGLQATDTLSIVADPMTDNSAAYWLANATGGRLFSENDTNRAFRELTATSANFYSLGYRSPHRDDGKYHRIEVRVKKADISRIEYRTGYLSAPLPSKIERAMQSPLSSDVLPGTIPLNLKAGNPTVRGREVDVPISIRIPATAIRSPSKRRDLRLYISVFDDLGKKLVAFETRVPTEGAGAVSFDNVIVVSRGKTNKIVAAVVDDLAQEFGTSSITVTY